MLVPLDGAQAQPHPPPGLGAGQALRPQLEIVLDVVGAGGPGRRDDVRAAVVTPPLVAGPRQAALPAAQGRAAAPAAALRRDSFLRRRRGGCGPRGEHLAPECGDVLAVT